MSADPSRFTTLDSLAFQRGAPWDAHKAKVLHEQRRRLRNKEQPLFCTPWPMETTPYTTGRTYNPATGWIRVMDTTAFAKARVVTRLCIVFAFMADAEFLLQVCTRAKPVDFGLASSTNPTDGDGLVVVGSDPDVIDLSVRTFAPLLAGPEEAVEVWARARVHDNQNITMLCATAVGLRHGKS